MPQQPATHIATPTLLNQRNITYQEFSTKRAASSNPNTL